MRFGRKITKKGSIWSKSIDLLIVGNNDIDVGLVLGPSTSPIYWVFDGVGFGGGP